MQRPAPMIFHHNDRAIGQRLAGLGGRNGLWACEDLLTDAAAIDGRVVDAVLIALRELNPVIRGPDLPGGNTVDEGCGEGREEEQGFKLRHDDEL